jgi:Flp pilus assembly pilin Flp
LSPTPNIGEIDLNFKVQGFISKETIAILPTTDLHWFWVWLMTRFWVALKAFTSGDRGQGLSEYCLLTALVALIALAVIVHVSGGMQAVWGNANTSIAVGNQAAGGPPDSTASAKAH